MNWKLYYEKMGLSAKKYPFYDGNFSYVDVSNSKVAKKLSMPHVGWGRRAVKMRANKTRFDRFENDTLGLNEMFAELNGREAFNKIKDDILVCGVGFLALAGDRIMPFTALEATGTYDWREQNLKDGVAIFKESTNNSCSTVKIPDSYMVFHKDSTEACIEGERTNYPNVAGRPLMTLLTHRATTKQPFGHSVITQTARDAIISASRTVRQAEVAGYHYNNKIDILLGIDSETVVDKVETQTGDVLKVGSNGDGQIPQVGQFAQHAMAPFSDSILMFARNFCSDTNLSLGNLGVAANAPQSPEALEIVGDDLRDDIEDWQAELGQQLKYFAISLWMARNNISELDKNARKKINAISVSWKPIFRVDLAKVGDGLSKIYQVNPELARARSILRNIGLSSEEIDVVVAAGTQT